MKKLVVLLFLLVNSALLQAADYSEGKHYKKLSSQQTSSGDKVVVEEFFWYGCPHCSTFEPYLKAWEKTKPADVEFARVPAIFLMFVQSGRHLPVQPRRCSCRPDSGPVSTPYLYLRRYGGWS